MDKYMRDKYLRIKELEAKASRFEKDRTFWQSRNLKLEEEVKKHKSFLKTIRTGVDLIAKEALFVSTYWAKAVLDGIDEHIQPKESLTKKKPNE